MRTIEIDFDFFIACMESATGKSREELLGRRTYPLPYYRAMVARSLREEGYSTPEIGRVLLRNHATILYTLRQLEDALTTRGWDDIAAICRSYQIEVAKGRVTKSPLELAAEEYVGKHCNKTCRFCDIKPEQCRYLQDEATFLAGARSYRDMVRTAMEDIREKTSDCSLLCGKDGLSNTLASLDAMLDK